ncbi:MAG: hypothetical protein WC979_05315 [Candidatus Pacearchaeota archaeon]|jgi:DNA-binding MarR family transcriptional regulator
MESETTTKTCLNCGNEFSRKKEHSYKDFEKRKYCSKKCLTEYRKNHPNRTFDKKAYLKEYTKKYRQRPEAKEKRKLEAKLRYKKEKIILDEKRKLEKIKTKEEKIKEGVQFVKYIRKDLALKYLRENSKESDEHKRTHFTNLIDSCDYALLLIILKRPDLQIVQLSEVIGIAQTNLHNHLKKLVFFNLISSSDKIEGKGRQKWRTKHYRLTDKGELLLNTFGDVMKDFILKDNEVRIESQDRKQARQMLLEVLKND